MVGSSRINVRESQSTTAKIVGSVAPQETFAVERKGEWYLILDGPLVGGYIRQDLVKLTGEKLPLAKIEATSIRVRSTPSMNGAVRGTMSSGEFFAGEKKGDWYEIKDGPYRGGFVSAQFIRPMDVNPSPPAVEPAPQPLGGGLTVVSQDPSATPNPPAVKESESQTREVPRPEVSRVLDVPVVPANPHSKIIVSANTPVRVRKGPSLQSPIAGAVLPGEILEAEQVGEWFEIKSGPRKGNFISARFVKREAQPAVPVSTSGATSPGSPGATTSGATASAGTGTAAAGAASVPSSQKTAAKATADDPFGVGPAWDEAVEKRFQDQVEKAFKKKGGPAAAATEVIMPVFYEGHARPIGQIETRVPADGTLSLAGTAFFKHLRMLVAEPWFERPAVTAIHPDRAKDPKEAEARAWIAISKFEGTGIDVTFDEKRLEIHVKVPAELRNPTVASVLRSHDGTDESEHTDPPSGFSSFLNINASQIIDSRFADFPDRRLPLRIQFENGTNIGGFVLEAYGKYLEDRTGKSMSPEFSRDDVRIVRDFPNQAIRSSVGDLIYPTQGFQIYRPMAGLSVTSNFSMARSRLTYPTGDYELFLKRDSKVYVWVNDQLQQVLELPAGRHSLRDFPFANGVNQLRFEIVDDVGRTETQTYSYFSSTELLRPKLHQYSYSVGAPMTTDFAFNREYDTENPTVSAFHRYGLLENLTLGANVQRDNLQTVAGAEALFSTSVGFFRVEPAVSLTEGGQRGAAVRTNYIYSDYKGPMKTNRSFNLGLVHRGASFATLGDTTSFASRQGFEVRAGYAQGLSRTISANLSGTLRYTSTTSGTQDSFTLNAGASRRFDSGMTLSATISHMKAQTGAEDISVLGFLLWSFPKDRQVVTAVHNTADQSSRVDWSHNPSAGAGASNYSVAFRDSASEQGYSGQILHDGNRFRSTIMHEVIMNKDITQSTEAGEALGKQSENVTSLYFGTALAFAGGHFTMGRPVTDSFAIVAPIKNLRGQRLDINPNGEDSYIAKSDFFGPALVPELGSYSRTDIKISARHLAPHLTLPKDHFSVYPRYKSGYAFATGTDATVYMQAKILGPDGAPISLAAGRAVYLDDLSEEPVTVFTNKSGVLRSEGFRVGRYRLEIATESFEAVEITIPESSANSHDLGTIQLKAK